MKISLNLLKQLIREEVMRSMIPGFYGGGGVSGMKRHKEVPPPDLGDETEQDREEDGKEQEKSQWAVRVRNKPGQRR